nr:hypothetical protein BaRGS_005465 [Batillaria attramentaria]
MEYREAPSSPTGGAHCAMDGDGMGSPTTPASPPPHGAGGGGHTERLPNELLDEICEDIGMKSGDMELDFVEFLMEQDMDPQAYMTPEAILSSGGTLQPSSGGSSGSGGGGGGGGNVSAASSNISTPSNSSGGGSGCGFGAVTTVGLQRREFFCGQFPRDGAEKWTVFPKAYPYPRPVLEGGSRLCWLSVVQL